MRYRFLVAASLLVVLAPVSAAPAAGQTRDSASEGWTAPRTPWGDPDLQGQWNSQTSTPLERPLEGRLAETDTLSVEEAQAIEAATARPSICRRGKAASATTTRSGGTSAPD